MSLLDSLVAYYEYDEASGTRNDSRGTNHLTDNNTVTSAAGKIGDAGQFVRANAETLSIADNADVSMGNISFTIASWVYLDSDDLAHNKAIVSKNGAAGAGLKDYQLMQKNGLFRFYVWNSADAEAWVVDPNTDPALSTWYLVIGWYDSVGRTINISTNNGTTASATITLETWVPNDGSAAFRIGGADVASLEWDGRVDETGLWKRLLTAQERTDLYNAGAGVAYNLFDPRTGNLAATEAPDVAALAGDVIVAGTLAAAEAPDAAALAGDVVVSGTLSATEALDVLAAYESALVGALAVTETRDVFAADGIAPSGHTFEMELAGLGLGWTDVTEDVLLESPGVSLQYGIAGTGPLDLVASTGTMKLSLKNGETNSAETLGYYSPRHASCRSGFQLGIRVRYSYIAGPSPYGKFIGRLRDIEPAPGQYRDRKTHCLVVDWMNEAAITTYNAPTHVAKRADEVLATIVALVPRQPDSTSYDVADSTFPYALDNGPTERSMVLTEIQRICQSEFGRCYVRGGAGYWGRLRFEKRTARLTPTPAATLNGTMQDLDAGSGTGKIKNKARVTAHPRRVDATNTVVLFSKPNQSNPAVAAAQAIKLSGKYVDPSNPNARVGGTDMIAPAATTDYLMNASADGGGADLTANFAVTAVLGANQVVYTITNNGGTTGYVTKLQARGRGLYDYDPLEAEEINQASIDLLGESAVTLDMPYQSAYTVTQAIAQFLVDTWSVAGGASEASIKFIPRTDGELAAAMALEPGVAITVEEELAVVNDVYFIQNVGLKITGDMVSFDWDLQRALVQDYWQLGTAGYSELGVTTVLAPL